MIPLTINPDCAEELRSHGNVCAKKLKNYTQEELVELAILAITSNSSGLLKCFMPPLLPLKDLQSAKVDFEQERLNPLIATTTTKTIKKLTTASDNDAKTIKE